jgi:carboxymethylenebutenolidase
VKDSIVAGGIRLTGDGGDEIEAYAALPQTDQQTAGVVVIHHMPGFDWATKEIVRRFAVWGYSAVCPNLHYREAPGAEPDDAAAANRAAGGVPDSRLLGDVSGARDYLLSQPTSNARTGVIGFCSGGRQSVLAACGLPFDAAVDCYGAFVLSPAPAGSGMVVAPLNDRLADVGCPLLGLFGQEDAHPAPEEVAELDALLTGLGKRHEFHTFPDAGHAFFAVDRQAAYRPAVAVEAWRLVARFYGDELGKPAFGQ